MEEGIPNHVLADAVRGLVEGLDQAMKTNLGAELTQIIETHAALNAGAGLIPIPGVDIAAAVANTWAMYARINGVIGVPFGENVTKSIASAIATNVVGIIPSIFFAEAGAALVKLFPGLGSLAGMVVGAATDYALEIVLAVIYLRTLTLLLGQKKPLTADNLRLAAIEMGNDKDFVKAAFNEAKMQYKTAS